MQDGMCSIAGMLLKAYRHNYNLNNMSIHIPKVKVKQMLYRQTQLPSISLDGLFQETYFTSWSYSVQSGIRYINV